MAETFTVTDTANMVGVSAPTIRRWALSFIESLSSEANPPKGAARRFTGRDVQTLAKAKQLQDEGLSIDDIAFALLDARAADLPDLDTLTTLKELSDDVSDKVERADLAIQATNQIAAGLGALSENMQALTGATVEIAELRKSIDSLTERLTEVERKLDKLPGIVKRW